jgi:bidirectional [NiFe] hydrogenase diaphorase subunit
MDLPELTAIAAAERAGRRPIQVRVCTAAGCLSSNARAVREQLEDATARAGLVDRVQVCEVGCLRLCSEGPLVRIEPEGSLYEQVAPEQAESIIGTLAGGTTEARRGDPNGPFFTRQHSIVLENCGVVEPERIESYLAAGGYRPLHHALREMSPAEVVEAITQSGLRGRGGAGYPTGLKWATVAKMPPGRKFVVCNADEGDPGAFMDRSVLESDPHRVLEGMAIAAYAVGAEQGYIYVRGEYTLAIRRLDVAIRQARRLGVLGSGIFDSPFNFRLDLRMGAGAFVCGEETALMNSIQGQRGIPRPRPPYPAQAGLWGDPTLLNNVETFANIPAIVREGAGWFAELGTAGSKGTKVFALGGNVRRSGLVEVPMGMTLREIVEEIGGGVPDGRAIKAVQMHRLLHRIGEGEASRADLERLEGLCDVVKHTSLCGLGQAAPNPVLSTLRFFRHEYEDRLRNDGPASNGSSPGEGRPGDVAGSRADAT